MNDDDLNRRHRPTGGKSIINLQKGNTVKYLILIALALSPVMAEAKGKKSKPAPTVTIQPAPVAPAPAPAPQPSFMDRQIAAALANTRPVGVTTYGAAAALQSGGVEAAEAASQGY